MNRRLLYLLALAPQLLLLGWMIAREEWNLANGQEVILEIEPYDPMHPVKGYYHQTRLAIAFVETGLGREPDWSPKLRETVYVLLEKGVNNHTAAGYSRSRPEQAGAVYLEGRVARIDPDGLTVDYGLSHYFVSMRAADPTLQPEVGDRRRQLQLRVRVRDDGSATIDTMLVDGEPFAEWNRRQ